MSILKRLERLYRHACLNCVYIDIMPDEPESFRYDCVCPEKLEAEYYWEAQAFKENDCKHFKNKNTRRTHND